MELAQDLLAQAHHLAAYQGSNATEGALRRSVSTAYYALFHLLLDNAARRWNGPPESGTAIQRAFNHGSMKTVSLQFQKAMWIDWHGTSHTIPPALRRVASAFVALQEERHSADYDRHEQFNATDTQSVLSMAAGAFQDWDDIHHDPLAGNYLLAMLIGKQR